MLNTVLKPLVIVSRTRYRFGCLGLGKAPYRCTSEPPHKLQNDNSFCSSHPITVRSIKLFQLKDKNKNYIQPPIPEEAKF